MASSNWVRSGWAEIARKAFLISTGDRRSVEPVSLGGELPSIGNMYHHRGSVVNAGYPKSGSSPSGFLKRSQRGCNGGRELDRSRVPIADLHGVETV